MNAYKRDLPRQERYFFYPKPWEALQTGPRPGRESSAGSFGSMGSTVELGSPDDLEILPLGNQTEAYSSQPLSDPLMLPDDNQ
jgi:hypothetical protein